MHGGSCINVACVPTKDLVVSAENRRADDDPQTYFTESVADRDKLIATRNEANYGMLDGQATLLDSKARFTGPGEVTVQTADGEVTVDGTTVLLATGRTPAHLVALATRAGVTADDLRDGIWTHPSSTEALNEVLCELAPYDS